MPVQYKSIYKGVGRNNVLIVFFNISQFTEKPNDIYLFASYLRLYYKKYSSIISKYKKQS